LRRPGLRGRDSGRNPLKHLPADGVDSRYAWLRLGVSMLMMIIGGSGMYTVIVVLPELQREFSVARADASLPYTLTMLGFGLGGVLLGRLADRRGVALPLMLGGLSLGAGFILAGLSGSLWQFSLIQGVLIGMLGSSASFGPLMADTSLWFIRRRGIAVALCASGNYLAGAICRPPIHDRKLGLAQHLHGDRGVLPRNADAAFAAHAQTCTRREDRSASARGPNGRIVPGDGRG
jgi:sugar phosphate permease